MKGWFRPKAETALQRIAVICEYCGAIAFGQSEEVLLRKILERDPHSALEIRLHP
jgi:hypothetical protein